MGLRDSISSNSPQSASTLSVATQSDFTIVAKAFSFVPMKLDFSNYLYWKAQIMETIRAFDLMQFVDKTAPPLKYMYSDQGE